MIAIGAKLEWTPRELEDHSLWEVVAYIDGLNRANGGNKTEHMSNDAFDALLAAHNIES